MADNALTRGAYQNFLSRVPDTADVTGTAYDSNGPIWRALGVGSAIPLTQPKGGPLENPNAESDYTWQRTPGSPYELPKWKQNVQDVLGSPGVNEFMTAANFLVPRPGAMMLPKMPEKPQGIRAYHGSPHDFDRFSLDKIGTGEGAQAYGHGLYFAENEGVARSYRDALKKTIVNGAPYQPRTPEAVAAQASVFTGGDKNAALKYPSDNAEFSGHSQGLRDLHRQALDLVNTKGLPSVTREPGHMYEVNINANPEHFLDWDKPLSQQSAAAQSAVRKYMNLSDGSKMADLGWANIADRPVGDAIGNALRSDTKGLRDAGIPGISYKDAGSRGASGGTRNHVVFDENLISILRKYGLAGLMAGGAASQKSDGQQ